MGGNLLAENSQEAAVMLLFFQETPVTAAKFLRNAGNRRYFCTNYRWFCFFSADPPLSVKKFRQDFDPGIAVVIV